MDGQENVPREFSGKKRRRRKRVTFPSLQRPMEKKESLKRELCAKRELHDKQALLKMGIVCGNHGLYFITRDL